MVRCEVIVGQPNYSDYNRMDHFTEQDLRLFVVLYNTRKGYKTPKELVEKKYFCNRFLLKTTLERNLENKTVEVIEGPENTTKGYRLTDRGEEELFELMCPFLGYTVRMLEKIRNKSESID